MEKNHSKNIFFIGILTLGILLFSSNLIQDVFALSITGTTFISPPDSPTITSITAGDPLNHPGFTSGDIITIEFSEQTNTPGGIGVLSQSQVDNIFTSSQNLGNDYTGQWVSRSTFVITSVNATGGNPIISTTTITVNTAAHLKNAAGTSSDSTSTSPPLGGDFGSPPTPAITALVVDGSNAAVGSGFRNRDTITVRFSESTNQPPEATTADINNLFTFSQSIGTDYTGKWINPSTLVITITNSTGGFPVIDITSVTVKNNLVYLKNADNTSIASTSVSPPLSGSFDTFMMSIPVAAGGTGSVVLPSGITSSITLPSTSSGTVTITGSLTASTDGTGGSKLGFIGNVTDLSAPSGACVNLCTFSFIFTSDDLVGTGISNPLDAKIFHDHNNDDDFKERDETLPTTVTQTASNTFLATATDDRTSKFAIGGIIATLAILGAGHGGGGHAGAAPSFGGDIFAANEYALSIDGKGFRLDSHTNPIPTTIIQTGKPVHLKLLTYERAGPDDMEHVAIYMNLQGVNPTISNLGTSITYEKNQPPQITDTNGLFSSVKMIPSEANDKFVLDYDITFAKPMKKSDIVVRAWDQYKFASDVVVLDALQVEGNSMVTSPVQNSIKATAQNSTTVKPVQVQIPTWLKNNAGWWHDNKIGNSDFLNGIRYLVQQGIMKIPQTLSGVTSSPHMPNWLKNNAGWWSSGQISDDDFANGIQYLLQQDIIKV